MSTKMSVESRANSWGAQRRLAFIEFRLCWEGRINRSDLQEFFKISVPQASNDLKAYRELAPTNVQYDASARAYLRAESFRPVIVRDDPAQYFLQLAAVHSEVLASDECFVGQQPPFDQVVLPARDMDREVAVALLDSIRMHRALTIQYQSMSGSRASTRTVTPFAVVSDGVRFHVRCYCHKRAEFRDFVVSRILAANDAGASTAVFSGDAEWHEKIVIKFQAHPRLTAEQRSGVEQEYRMKDGTRTLEVRRALAFYMLQRLRFDEFRKIRAPSSQQLCLINEEDLEKYLPKIYEPSI
jgi:hypothetical protein